MLRNERERAIYDNAAAHQIAPAANQPQELSIAVQTPRIYRDAPEANKHSFAWWSLVSSTPFLIVAAVVTGICAYLLFTPSKPLAPGTTFTDCTNCPSMMVIPAGTFQMGSESDNEKPIHEVTLSRPFAVGKFEVTNSQYAEFLTSMLRQGKLDQRFVSTYPSDLSSHLLVKIQRVYAESGYESYPVAGVTWGGAKAYVEWLSHDTGHNYRLLSEAEWEYSARGGTSTKYYFGDNAPPALRIRERARSNASSASSRLGCGHVHRWLF